MATTESTWKCSSWQIGFEQRASADAANPRYWLSALAALDGAPLAKQLAKQINQCNRCWLIVQTTNDQWPGAMKTHPILMAIGTWGAANGMIHFLQTLYWDLSQVLPRRNHMRSIIVFLQYYFLFFLGMAKSVLRKLTCLCRQGAGRVADMWCEGMWGPPKATKGARALARNWKNPVRMNL